MRNRKAKPETLWTGGRDHRERGLRVETAEDRARRLGRVHRSARERYLGALTLDDTAETLLARGIAASRAEAEQLIAFRARVLTVEVLDGTASTRGVRRVPKRKPAIPSTPRTEAALAEAAREYAAWLANGEQRYRSSCNIVGDT